MENEGIRDIRSYARYLAYRGIALPPERETRLKLASPPRERRDEFLLGADSRISNDFLISFYLIYEAAFWRKFALILRFKRAITSRWL